METINRHDHSNTPGAIKRRRRAARNHTIAGIIVSFAVVGAAIVNATTGVAAQTMEPADTQLAQTTMTVPAEGVSVWKQLEEKHAAETPAPEPEVVEEAAAAEPEWFEVEATAYCSCAKCCGEWAYNRPGGVVYTADGSVAQVGVTIAADWDVFPAGTVLYIDGLGERIVQDKGGAINDYDVDVYFDDHQEALQFGRQHLRAYVVSYGG